MLPSVESAMLRRPLLQRTVKASWRAGWTQGGVSLCQGSLCGLEPPGRTSISFPSQIQKFKEAGGRVGSGGGIRQRTYFCVSELPVT